MSEAVVVGGGIMGLCTAWALVRRGWHVTVLEQGTVPNPLGSSSGEHRLIRHAYGDSVGYTNLVPPAWDAWDALWADLGRSYYRPTGTLAFGTGEATGWTERSRATLDQLGIDLTVLDRSELEARYPWLLFDEVTWGFWMESGGALLCGPILEALAEWLRAHGADIVEGATVTDVDLEAGTVTAGEQYVADAVVVAAGPWTPRLLPGLNERVTPSRQVLALIEPPDDLKAAWETSPMILDVGTAGFYAVPPVEGTSLKIGDHTFSMSGDPDRDRDAHDAEVRAVFECARTRFADFDRYRLAGSRTCFYSVEPQEQFIVEPRGRGWVLAGFSGHGFKFGAWVGQAVASNLVDGANAATITRLAAGG